MLLFRSSRRSADVMRAAALVFLFLSCSLLPLALHADAIGDHKSDGLDTFDTCIVGAGPAGLQLAYFLQQAGRSYVVFEKASSAGHFFQRYPVHRRLISINKIYTDRGDHFVEPEEEVWQFNQRHDWNSLISHDPELLFGKFSPVYYPSADKLVTWTCAAQSARLTFMSAVCLC